MRFPERASYFEMLKEFQASQSTTCHLLFANAVSRIDCLSDSIEFAFLIESAKLQMI